MARAYTAWLRAAGRQCLHDRREEGLGDVKDAQDLRVVLLVEPAARCNRGARGCARASVRACECVRASARVEV